VRGIEFAKTGRSRGKVTAPAVVGAVIDLGFCLDLISSTGVAAVKAAHEDFIAYANKADKPVPKNRLGPDRLLRDLDCAVINHLHNVRDAAKLPAFQTVRAVFIEGGRIYEEAGFFEKTHIQICVREKSCIKGVFRVSDDYLTA
jgi:hypothetical protein